MRMAPVPQTDTRGHVKSTKALERFTAKELGKITPLGAAEKWLRRLFNKNTGLCEIER